jgi:hypothetical protein
VRTAGPVGYYSPFGQRAWESIWKVLFLRRARPKKAPALCRSLPQVDHFYSVDWISFLALSPGASLASAPGSSHGAGQATMRYLTGCGLQLSVMVEALRHRRS